MNVFSIVWLCSRRGGRFYRRLACVLRGGQPYWWWGQPYRTAGERQRLALRGCAGECAFRPNRAATLRAWGVKHLCHAFRPNNPRHRDDWGETHPPALPLNAQLTFAGSAVRLTPPPVRLAAWQDAGQPPVEAGPAAGT